jgi:hypothetical protein
MFPAGKKKKLAVKKANIPQPPGIVKVEKAANEIVEGLVSEGIIASDFAEKASPKVVDIILKIQHHSAIVRGFFVSPFAVYTEQEKYEAICPGVTDRQMKVFEERMATRNWCDKVKVICVPIGLLCAFSIVLYGMWIGVSLIREGKTLDGLTSMFAPLIGLAGLFILTKPTQHKKEKDTWD